MRFRYTHCQLECFCLEKKVALSPDIDLSSLFLRKRYDSTENDLLRLSNTFVCFTNTQHYRFCVDNYQF